MLIRSLRRVQYRFAVHEEQWQKKVPMFNKWRIIHSEGQRRSRRASLGEDAFPLAVCNQSFTCNKSGRITICHASSVRSRRLIISIMFLQSYINQVSHCTPSRGRPRYPCSSDVSVKQVFPAGRDVRPLQAPRRPSTAEVHWSRPPGDASEIKVIGGASVPPDDSAARSTGP